MDLNGLFNMLAKMFISQAVDTGIDYAARQAKPESEMTPEEKDQAQRARDLSERAKQVQNLTRRLWR